MSGLSEFSKNYTPKKDNNISKEKIEEMKNQNFDKNEQENIEKTFKENYEKLNGLNQNELMGELLKESQKLKNNGQFDYGKLANAINNMSGYINEEQKQKMLELLGRIK